MRAIVTTIASSLLLAGCVSTQGVSLTCDIHYVGPVPRHLVEAGRTLNPMTVELPSDMVLRQCETTPVGCIDGNFDLGWYFVIITNEPERWDMTRQEIIDHELAHWGEFELTGDANAGHCGWEQ